MDEQEIPLDDLISLWRSKIPAVQRLPARADFGFEELLPWMGWISIYDVERGSRTRLRMRLVGSHIVTTDRRDYTGRYLDEVFPKAAFPAVHAPYQEALETRQPVLLRRVVPTSRGVPHRLAKLVLPLASDGVTIDKFLVVLHYRLVEEGLDALPRPVI